jgi:hypothetical protein
LVSAWAGTADLVAAVVDLAVAAVVVDLAAAVVDLAAAAHRESGNHEHSTHSKTSDDDTVAG